MSSDYEEKQTSNLSYVDETIKIFVANPKMEQARHSPSPTLSKRLLFSSQSLQHEATRSISASPWMGCLSIAGLPSALSQRYPFLARFDACLKGRPSDLRANDLTTTPPRQDDFDSTTTAKLYNSGNRWDANIIQSPLQYFSSSLAFPSAPKASESLSNVADSPRSNQSINI